MHNGTVQFTDNVTEQPVESGFDISAVGQPIINFSRDVLDGLDLTWSTGSFRSTTTASYGAPSGGHSSIPSVGIAPPASFSTSVDKTNLSRMATPITEDSQADISSAHAIVEYDVTSSIVLSVNENGKVFSSISPPDLVYTGFQLPNSVDNKFKAVINSTEATNANNSTEETFSFDLNNELDDTFTTERLLLYDNGGPVVSRSADLSGKF
jgi:hypothetical protein